VILFYHRLHFKDYPALKPLHVVATEDVLLGIFFKPPGPEMKGLQKKKTTVIHLLEQQLFEYLEGRRKKFKLPLKLSGTDFQQQAWKALLKIPYGTTVSYQAQAKSMGRPRAVRAVGSANGKNYFPIVIPCHRVIAKDATLGGYAAGLKMKKFLLDLERNNV
jgi:O-6-methylguanine DNA methyltransferase